MKPQTFSRKFIYKISLFLLLTGAMSSSTGRVSTVNAEEASIETPTIEEPNSTLVLQVNGSLSIVRPNMAALSSLPVWSSDCTRSNLAACMPPYLTVSDLPTAWQPVVIAAAQTWSNVGTDFRFGSVNVVTENMRSITMEDIPTRIALGEVRVMLLSQLPGVQLKPDINLPGAVVQAAIYPPPDSQGKFLAALIVINDVDLPIAQNWSINGNPTSNQYDLQTIALHEFGHAAGLTHCGLNQHRLCSGNNQDIMRPTISTRVVIRLPSEADIQDLINIYGAISPIAHPQMPILLYPNNDEITISVRPTFAWQQSSGATSYYFQLSKSYPTFLNEDLIQNVRTANLNLISTSDLAPNTSYYWRVKASDSADNSNWSTIRHFRTASVTGDTTPPTGSWTNPSNGATINSSTVTLNVNASDNHGGSGVREVRFSAKWNNQWFGVGNDSSAPYSIDWNWCNSGVPNGDVELGMEVWDNANNKWVYSDHSTNYHITKNYNCGPPITVTPPTPVVVDGIEVCDSTNYGAPCKTYTYISDGTCINLASDGWDNKIESLRFKGTYIGGYSIILFDDNSCGTYIARYGSDANTLGMLNNLTGSFRIEDPPTDDGDYPPEGFTRCADEGSHCNFGGTADVVYGARRSWTSPRSFTDGVDCNNSVFGDPIVGPRKKCYIRMAELPGIWCAKEGDACSFGSNKIATVYYGLYGIYIPKQGVVSSTSCDSGTFGGDPYPGLLKACYYVITGNTLASVSTAVNVPSVNVGDTALVTVSLNNVPAEGGYPSAEFTCTYNATLLEASNITISTLFGADAIAAINGPQNGSFIVAIAGSNGNKATGSGAVFTFNVKALQAGQTSLECTARVSKGDGSLIPLPSTGPATLTIGGGTITPTFTPTPTASPTPTETLTPTVTPTPPSLLTGQVIASKPVTVNLYNTDNTLAASTPANVDGTFTLTLSSGNYTVIATASGFLSAQGSVTITGGNTATMPTIDLLAGDIDNNNVIDQFDAMTIGMSYNTATPSAADLNNDGTINVLDLELLAANYRDAGPIVWQ